MKNLICILLIFSGIAAKAQGTYSISGTVKDDKGLPVAGANVFLTSSTKKTSTNTKGEFQIIQLSSGSYELVVSTLGFNTYSQSIVIREKSAEFDIELKADIVTLNEVVIKAVPDAKRRKYLELFKRYFIGETANAKHCELLNPEVLKFNYDTQKELFEVSSREPLIIENKALGYRINYLLNNFRLAQKGPVISVSYKGLPYFEEMQGTKPQQTEWSNNREKVYEGSFMHFFRAAFSNSIEQEGFLIYRINKQNARADTLVKAELNPVIRDSIFTSNAEDFRWSVKFKDPLVVIYTREREPGAFLNSGNHIKLWPKIDLPQKLFHGEGQISVLDIVSDNFLVDRNGAIPPESVMSKGYWSWEIMGDLLPTDYVSTSNGDSLLKVSKGVQNYFFGRYIQDDDLLGWIRFMNNKK